MNISLKSEQQPLVRNDAGHSVVNCVGVDDVVIKISVEDILKHQEHDLNGPKTVKIILEDKANGKQCSFDVRTVSKNGRPGVEINPTNQNMHKRLLFGKMSEEVNPDKRPSVRSKSKNASAMAAALTVNEINKHQQFYK
jgi:hypothetical protein